MVFSIQSTINRGHHADEIEIENVGFFGVGKTGVTGDEPLWAAMKTNKELNPNMTTNLGIAPGPH